MMVRNPLVDITALVGKEQAKTPRAASRQWGVTMKDHSLQVHEASIVQQGDSDSTCIVLGGFD